MIRDILMGQQISEYESRFQELENTIRQMSELYEQKLTDLKKEHAAQTKQMQEANSQRFDKLEAMIHAKINSLDNKLEKVSQDDKHDLGQMLAKIGAKLMKDNV
ncbi:MAG: hypothetical protein DHS20C18_13450 [Saprospiraceae bacterium]|nr:MAG: hypothetical protein DHS20C18_13450 [Saprospiraceae bacterium]